jgi:hypothetical protein
VSKPIRITALALVAILLAGAGICLRGCNRNRSALAKYKAELRAKGEKLSAEELGYPKPPEKSPGLDRLLAAAKRVGVTRFQPADFAFMSFSGPGRVKVSWASASPMLKSPTNAAANGDLWEAITMQFTNAAEITVQLREAVQTPPRYFYNDPTNFANPPRGPFVGIRAAAHWLAGDVLVALREHRLEDAEKDICALAKLVQFHREDCTLVTQMIRVAVAGLGLSATWQALQADGWNEEMLAAIQKDWEAVNLGETFEVGMVGERAFGGSLFPMMRSASSSERLRFFRLNVTTRPVQLRTPKDYFDAYMVMPFWAADSDEMFFLEHHQRSLDSIRKLHAGVPWSTINAELNSHHASLSQVFGSPMSKYRYPFSAIAIPSFLRAAETCVRSETQRRMTVTAIALERYKLRSGTYPPNLEALIPGFLPAVPIDLMSAKPLCYRLNADGTFKLYSVGEDARDDGGDPTPSTATSRFALWSGRDAVWPVADTKN